jgi:hypothetical protein
MLGVEASFAIFRKAELSSARGGPASGWRFGLGTFRHFPKTPESSKFNDKWQMKFQSQFSKFQLARTSFIVLGFFNAIATCGAFS